MKAPLHWTILPSLAILVSLGAADPSCIVEVEGGARDPQGAPVVLQLPAAFESSRGFALETLDSRQPVPAQRVLGDRPGLAFIVRDLPLGAKRRYRLTSAEPSNAKPAVSCTYDRKGLVLAVGDHPVLRYNCAIIEAPEGLASYYRRSGHIHPLQTPTGQVVTADFAPDHAHQHGLFFAWVNTTFNGHKVDFWNQQSKLGEVKHVEVLDSVSGPVFGQFRVKIRHEDITNPGAPVPVLDEVWTVRAYNLTDHFLVDLESRQVNVASLPLEMNKYHYGGLGLRGNSAWFDPKAQGNDPPEPERSGRSDFLTSEGKGRLDGNHTRPRWVDLSGMLGEAFAGVTILDHPDNFRFPQPVRLHPNKPYFCFAPMVLDRFAIEPGQSYVSRYRLCVHDGRPDRSAIEGQWLDYAEGPKARWVENE